MPANQLARNMAVLNTDLQAYYPQQTINLMINELTDNFSPYLRVLTREMV